MRLGLKYKMETELPLSSINRLTFLKYAEQYSIH